MNHNRSSILLIYTGGTIGMIKNHETGVLEAFNLGYLMENVPELKRMNINISSVQFEPPIDSSEMSPYKWSEIARVIELNYAGYDGFVVLHGTDTMAYTASALSFMLENLSKPVVLTGSQLPIGMLRTDGKENLITALEIAAAKTENGCPRVPEVCILFENYLMRGNRTRKINAENFSAFRSFNYPVLASVGIDIKYNDYLILHPDANKSFTVHHRFDNNIVILKLFPGMNPEYVKAILSIPDLKGVIMETYGSGNALTKSWFVNMMREAVDRGIIILNISQCLGGSVQMDRYSTGNQLLDVGVISGYDSTTEAALTKMMYLFGCGYSVKLVKTLLNTSIIGEISIGDVH